VIISLEIYLTPKGTIMKFLSRTLLICSVFALAACSSSNNGQRAVVLPPDFAKVQVLHAISDAPAVNVIIDGNEALSGVEYKQASAQISIEAGTHSIQVDAVLPGGATTPVFGPADVDFAADTITTISAVGPLAIPIDVSVESIPDTGPAAGSARVFILHAAPGANDLPVDVYVDAYSEPNAPIGTSAPFQFAFKGTLGPVELAAGDYQIRVTLRDSDTPVYDSGLVALGDGDDISLVAVPNISGGSAAVSLVAMGADGSGDILDVGTPAGLRVGHLSPDTGPVDIRVAGDVFPGLGGVPFPTVVNGFISLPADTYPISITEAGNPGAIAFGPVDLALDAGVFYTVLATDFNANLTVDILTDDARPVALYSKVRIIHASPTAQQALQGNVDIYLTDPALEGDITNESPALTDVAFGDNTGYLPLTAGTYDVFITATGDKAAAISSQVQIEDGGVYTVIARDPAPGSMEFGLEVQVDVLNEDT
jgi:hypothetical protein